MRRPRAFTLIELVAVMVILAIASALIVPRVMSGGVRQAEARLSALADVLTFAAKRARLAGQRVALEHDQRAERLVVLVRRSADATSFDSEATWREDPLLPAASLEGLEIREARVDGASIDLTRTRFELNSAGARAELTLALEAPGLNRSWTVLLDPWLDRAAWRAGVELSERAVQVDLDAAGRRDDAW